MSETYTDKNIIDLGQVIKALIAKKKTFFIVWPIVFALSCLWIFPEPRYYTCEVSLAPEMAGEDVAGGLAGLASNFGINIGGGGTDAIYPMLYPDLMDSNEFVVDMLTIQVTKEDKSLTTDYYTYLKKHQKKNWLTEPFKKAWNSVKAMFTEKKAGSKDSVRDLDPFMLSERDNGIVEKVRKDVSFNVDKKTDVISIEVKDQDRVICATLADSIRQHLQNYITLYRTKKTRVDVEHYQSLADSAKQEYRAAVNAYAQFCDANQDIILQSQQSQRDELENEMQMSYNTYQAMKTQLEAMKAKLQERTPAFTTLKSPTVPIKPAGPKRVVFVIGMLFLSTVLTCLYFTKNFVKEQMKHVKA